MWHMLRQSNLITFILKERIYDPWHPLYSHVGEAALRESGCVGSPALSIVSEKIVH
jgi:hypothetical protein